MTPIDALFLGLLSVGYLLFCAGLVLALARKEDRDDD